MKRKIFTDEEDRKYLSHFSDTFLVVCPRCGNCAQVIINKSDRDTARKVNSSPRKIVCPVCAYYKLTDTPGYGRDNFDWYFRLPLWLQIPCCGEVLWAYNLNHLIFLEDYVGASLRRRNPNQNQSLASRLPKWMKEAKNRRTILKCIEKLKDNIPQQ